MDKKWNSRRSPVFALNGIVASSQPLASEAGLSILKKGGNAADAAVAVAAVLNVTQPTSTGIGGDVFCLFFDAQTKTVKGINGSGRCASGLTLEYLQSLGYNETNRPGPLSPFWVTVPGAVAGWVDTIEKIGSGKVTLAEILSYAISLAETGYPVNLVTAHYWKNAEKNLQSAPNGSEMLINNLAPLAGQIMKLPNLAKSFRLIAQFGKDGFYQGEIAQSIVDVITQNGGVLSLEDLRSHSSTFEEPISIDYHGVQIYECPPNGQGIIGLLALNILEGFEVGNYEHNSAQHLHYVIESLRLAFSDGRFYVADPAFVPNIPISGMLSKNYAGLRRELIKPNVAIENVEHGFPETTTNTVYFSVVDGEGNACSFINSNYMGFGTCIVPQGTGFTLHNRGDGFSLDPSHANRLEPNKRPYHTIIPGMAMKDGELFASFGVMGGFMQPQGHLQVISNMVDFNMDPQEALDAARVQISDGESNGSVLYEEGISQSVIDELLSYGHKMSPSFSIGWDRSSFGTGQIITRNPANGVLCAGSDPRNDGLAIGF